MIFANNKYILKIWDGTKISSLVVIDTETTVKPFTETPEMVIGSAYGGGGNVYLIRNTDVEEFLRIHKASSFIFHNAPFDIDVLTKQEPTFNPYELYDSNRIFDTGVLYRLFILATKGFTPKRFNLKLITKELLDIDLEKGEERTTYEQYLNQPIELMPIEYQEYAAKDAIITWLVYFKLRALIAPLDKFNTLLSHHIQVKGDLALNHIYKRGIEFDISRRDVWLKAADNKLNGIQNRLATWGWVRGMKGNKEKYEDIVNFIGIGKLLPRTKDNNISCASEDLKIYSNFPFINDYTSFIELEKKASFVRDQKGKRIHPRYNLLMNTGRTSSTKPNIQQLPRSGVIRSMYKAKPNNTLIISDYSAIELATLSQVMLDKFGKSVMAERINAGECLHYYYASEYHNTPVENITKEQRGQAKAPNFGFPGGLGLDTFIEFSKGYGLDLDRDTAQKMKDIWFKAFPETRSYLATTQEGSIYTLTGRCRAHAFYCAAANTPFQGLASDGAKLALYNLDKERFNTVAFIHDEVVIEENIWDASDACDEIEEIMISSMKQVVPDVKISVESQLSMRYCK